ncbi:MAG: protocatechuate 3,4-dioxygenase, alpha subunit [Solirubrobacteraceae bacterium]|nr:protocatechuate 3,4-dioxygenase, alpha subunit [Solirubrobacteraceae bacterium]
MAPLATTPSQTVGPFFEFALLHEGWSADAVAPQTPGAVVLAGRVLDGDGQPVPDAMLEIWQAEPDGAIGDGRGLFARAGTDADGAFAFTTVKPGSVPGRDGRPQAPHIAMSVFARGVLHRLATRVYFPDEEQANATDPVLSAIGDPEARAALVARPEGAARLGFDVRLQGEGETPFFDV